MNTYFSLGVEHALSGAAPFALDGHAPPEQTAGIVGFAQLSFAVHLQIGVYFRAVVQRAVRHDRREGGTERRRNDFDHSTSAQSPAPFPPPPLEERSRVAAARQGRVHRQVRHVGSTEGPLPAHAEQRRDADGRIGKGQEGKGRSQGFDEHDHAAEEALQSPLHVPAHRRGLLRAHGRPWRPRLRTRPLPDVGQIRTARSHLAQIETSQPSRPPLLPNDATHDHHGRLSQLEEFQGNNFLMFFLFFFFRFVFYNFCISFLVSPIGRNDQSGRSWRLAEAFQRQVFGLFPFLAVDSRRRSGPQSPSGRHCHHFRFRLESSPGSAGPGSRPSYRADERSARFASDDGRVGRRANSGRRQVQIEHGRESHPGRHV